MVEAFFGLRKRPFLAVPRIDSYVATSASAGAIGAGVHCIERGDGPVLLVGGAGLGKTLCLMKMAERLHTHSQMQVALIAGAQVCTRRALLQTVLFHLGLPCQETDEGRLRLAVLSHLRTYGSDSRPVLKAYPRGLFERSGVVQPSVGDGAVKALVLLFDEAQTLSVKLLDEIRVLTNVLGEEGSCVRVVFGGTHRLEDTLAHPQLESLNQRIGLRAYLAPLHLLEVREYMAGKLALSGGELGRIFRAEAVEAIYRASEGIPRLVDQLADQAMDSAASDGESMISADRVRMVWSRLHQLPVTWGGVPSVSAENSEEGASAIEYGDLEEPLGGAWANDAMSDESHSESDSEVQVAMRGSSQFDDVEIEASEVGELAEVGGKNYFDSFLADRHEEPKRPSEGDVDEAFRGLIASMRFEAVRLDPHDRMDSARGRRVGQHVGDGLIVGESVDGDDRDMLVIVDGEYGDYPYVARGFQPRVS